MRRLLTFHNAPFLTILNNKSVPKIVYGNFVVLNLLNKSDATP